MIWYCLYRQETETERAIEKDRESKTATERLGGITVSIMVRVTHRASRIQARRRHQVVVLGAVAVLVMVGSILAMLAPRQYYASSSALLMETNGGANSAQQAQDDDSPESEVDKNDNQDKMLTQNTARVSCGGHSAPNCALCPVDDKGVNQGETWCHGDCTWDGQAKQCTSVW